MRKALLHQQPSSLQVVIEEGTGWEEVLCTLYVTQQIERDQLGEKFKNDILLFPKWLFFQLQFGAKMFEISLHSGDIH